MQTQRESFIIRLQYQIVDKNKPEGWTLRGQIEHTPSGQAWRFASLEQVPKIIDAYLHQLTQLKNSQIQKEREP